MLLALVMIHPTIFNFNLDLKKIKTANSLLTIEELRIPGVDNRELKR